MSVIDTPRIAAHSMGVDVPWSPYLNDTRIERLNAGRYEGQEITGALGVVTRDDVVLEMGAGLGVVGAAIAKNCRPKRIRSFEANPAMIPVIEELYSVNRINSLITVTNKVLWAGPDRPKSVPFYVGNSFLGSSLTDKENRQTTRVDVATESFDAVCRRSKPTVLVMDIEGGERDILEHANLNGIRAIVLEFHPEVYGVPGMRQCKRILTGQGFAKQDALSTRTVWTCLRQP